MQNNQTTEIFIANTDAEIESCFEVFYTLRPHLVKEEFVSRIRRQQSQNFQIAALKHDRLVKSAAGFRFADFLAWGKVLYVDDLSTLSHDRSKGFASSLLDWLIEQAKLNRCQAVHLDTGYARHAAHRVYIGKGFQLNCHHMVLEL